MKIRNIKYSKKSNTCVLSAQLLLGNGKAHDIYFEVDKVFENFMAKDANPFLSAALPIAMKQKEDLKIDGTVSKRLMTNTSKIMQILKNWNVGLDPVSVKTNIVKKDQIKPKNVACFFSGGVDSFFTYRKNKNKIDYLIFVHGFDISIKDVPLYKKIEKNIIHITKKENVKLIRVKTNIRETFEKYFDWNMSHAFALASVSLFLKSGFNQIYMSCGQTDIDSPHHFMSPELDILWSTENMMIRHYGCDADKIIKLKYLSNDKIAMENLRVCWLNKKKEYNCCECEKCFRNMLALYVSNSLERCKTFKKKINTGKLKNISLGKDVLPYFIAAQVALERKNDRSRIMSSLEECITRNRYPTLKRRLDRNTRSLVRYFDKKYNRNRLYWFLAQRGYIT